MSQPDLQQSLLDAIEVFDAIDINVVSKKKLGEESIEHILLPLHEDISKTIHFAKKVSQLAADAPVQVYIKTIQDISKSYHQLINLNNSEFLEQKNKFIELLKNQQNTLKSHLTHFTSAAVFDSGLLDDSDRAVRQANIINSLELAATKAQESIRAQAAKAKQEVNDSVKQVRLTAGGSSIEEAQKQFSKAQTQIYAQIAIWLVLGAVAMGFFFWNINLYIEKSRELPADWTWQLAVYAGLRATLLGALASLATYCLKILKSQLHILQINSHRVRLANSMAAFVEVGQTPEQRGMIIMRLLDPIIDFGGSGLIPTDGDGINTTQFTVDAIKKAGASE